VCEVKSGPGFQKADGSELVAVMRRDGEKAKDFAKRHGVAKAYDRAEDLVGDADVDAVYVATPPSTHLELSMLAAEAGKPCLVEKPMAMNHAECLRMVNTFASRSVPLFVAYYRRAFPSFLKIRDLLRDGAIGRLTSVHIVQYGRLATEEEGEAWRYQSGVAGGGLFMDLGSHGLDILDFLVGPVREVGGFSVNTGGTYSAEDATVGSFICDGDVLGTGVWNFHADHSHDEIVFTGAEGELRTPVFTNRDVVVRSGVGEERFPFSKPEHVHQPFIQTVVDELLGRGRAESTGETGARTAWVMDACLKRVDR